MKKATELVVENMVKLRKRNGLTQIDLAQKINFSDKAISRWENGTVIPSIDVLEKLAETYQVEVAYFFEEHLDEEEHKIEDRKFNLYLSIMFSLILVVWTIAVLTFFTLHNYLDKYYFQTLMWAVPLTIFVISWCCKHYFNRKFWLLSSSFGFWITLIAVYIQFYNMNLWPIFFFGIPVQFTMILSSVLYKVNKPKTKRNKTAEKIENWFNKRRK